MTKSQLSVRDSLKQTVYVIQENPEMVTHIFAFSSMHLQSVASLLAGCILLNLEEISHPLIFW